MGRSRRFSRDHRRRMRRLAAGAACAGALVGGGSLLPAGAAVPPEPTYGTASVDGSPGEWAAGDVFGPLVSDRAPYPALATASLRYDCDAGVLYVYVAANPGVVLQAIDPDEDYVRLGGGKLVTGLSGDDGVPPDFAWLGLSGDTASGWEASAEVAEGSYPVSLRIHAKVPDDSADGYQVIDLQPRYSDLTLTCEEVEASSTTSTPPLSTTTSTTEPPVVEADQEDAPVTPAAPAPVVSPATGSSGLTG